MDDLNSLISTKETKLIVKNLPTGCAPARSAGTGRVPRLGARLAPTERISRCRSL